MTKVETKTTKSQPAKKASSAKKGSATKKEQGAPQRILDCVLLHETMHNESNAPRQKVMSASGVKSSTFPVTISGMKKKGLIEYDKEFIRLTEEGRAQANPAAVPIDNKTAQDEIREKHKVGGKAALLFDILVDGCTHDRAEIQTAIGCDNKATFSVMICNLKKKEIIEYDKTTIRMTDLCFPLGRP